MITYSITTPEYSVYVEQDTHPQLGNRTTVFLVGSGRFVLDAGRAAIDQLSTLGLVAGWLVLPRPNKVDRRFPVGGSVIAQELPR